MKKWRILALLLALLAALSLMGCNGGGDTEDEPDDETPPSTEEDGGAEVTALDSGHITGTDITWEFYSDGALYIKGEGAMPEDMISSAEMGSNRQPWGVYATARNDHSKTIKRVIVEEGVTGLSQMCFKNCIYLETVLFTGSGITKIPFDCFNGCTSLRRVTAKGVTQIAENAFQGCKLLSSLTLSASLAAVSDGAFHEAGTEVATLTLTLAGTEEEWNAAKETLQLADPTYANKLIADAMLTPKYIAK